MATSLETMLVFLGRIKTKYDYVLATESKTGAKLISRSLDKKLMTYYIIGFVNWKQKTEVCMGGNQATQT